LWEIDLLRGTAVVTMVLYHLAWNLWYFGALPGAGDPYSGGWRLLQRFTAVTFVFLTGLSVTLADRRLEQRGLSTGARFRYFLRRGAAIFAWGMVVTAVVWLAGIGYINFGILHLLGFAVVFTFPFRRFTWVNVAAWALLSIAGGYVPQVEVQTLWFVWLGLAPAGYTPLDYFPVIPWFGVALLGIAAGNLLYPDGVRRYALPDWGHNPAAHALRWLGSHSLPIYLLHQPTLLALLYLAGITRV
jgi:uncharacterized membrane protein